MLQRLRGLARTLRSELDVYRGVARDARTPWPAKALLGLAVGYMLLPFDLVPDFIPVLGHIDDLLIVPGLAALALRLVPPSVVEEHRARVQEAQRRLGWETE